MKTTKLILSIVIISLLAMAGCSKTASEPAELSPAMVSLNEVNAATISDANNIQLSLNLALLKELAKENKNTFYSSFSISQALTMTYFGAGGETQSEIQSVLGFDDLTMEEIAAYQKYLLENYKKTGDTTFYSANSIWIDDEIIVRQSYMDTMDNNFDVEVENIDLQGSNAVKDVNKWIEKSTEGMIPVLFEQPFDPLTRLLLINAIYFDGKWTTPFNPHWTREMDFNGFTSTESIDMMYYDDEVMAHEGGDYKAISLPYGKDERFTFVAVLPSDDINAFINELDADKLQDVLATFEERSEATILLPKFEMEQTILLNDVLKTLGMEQAFNSGANLSEISDTNLVISRVLHKAKITVDESGTKASAVTAVEANEECMPADLFEFICDKPFIYFIVDTEDDTVLFTGVMYDAKK